MKPIMNTKVYWWNAIRTGINVGCVLSGCASDKAYLLTMMCRFQVPGGLGSYTVELEDDKSVAWPIGCDAALFLTLVAGQTR